MYKRSSDNWTKHLDFMLLDLFCVVFSFVLAYLIRHGFELVYAVELYRNILVVLALVHFLVVFFNSSYQGILRRGYWKEFLAVLRHNLYLIAFLLFYLVITQTSYDFSRVILLLFPLINILMMYAIRLLLKAWIKKFGNRLQECRALLVITSETIASETLERLKENQYGSFWITGVVLSDGDKAPSEINGVPVVAKISDVLDYIRINWVDEVFIRVPNKDSLPEKLIQGLSETGLTVHISLNQFASTGYQNQSVERLGGYTVLTGYMASASSVQLFLKRLLDIFGALVGLFLTGIVFLIFAPIILIQSPGPIFFSQDRVGKNGKIFRIYKFRSMYADAEERKKELMAQNKMNGLMFKMDNDPRITPIGKFMRATSLDEFPQFWNILRGEMSLVGTRPPTVDEYKQYELHHKARLATKPGLTGLWQVSGRSDITDFEEVVALDKKYISEWNFGLDIKILLKTVLIVLKRDGAE